MNEKTTIYQFEDGIRAPFVPFAVMEKSGVALISNRSQCGGSKLSKSSRFLIEPPIGELSEQEFCARYYIPDSISIQV